ncbi:hypothetical protein EWH70_10195 [Amycolatopsis suaedae]|uniref:Uncharacterized protein n=1 Tax=Amycolatopsis suaedae TaxID=2510978 RepID=A0A4Q7JBG8_9PSEU|nr:hypothetical protein EWH70_10195 [Amycolatopsis suaedae]
MAAACPPPATVATAAAVAAAEEGLVHQGEGVDRRRCGGPRAGRRRAADRGVRARAAREAGREPGRG